MNSGFQKTSRIALLLSSSVIAVVLSGCANFGARPSSEVKIPDRFSVASIHRGQNNIAGDWWKTANDNVLDSILSRIDRDNLSLEQARARLQSARASANIGAFLPNITAGSDVQYNRLVKGTATLNPIGAGSTEKNTGYYNAKVDASWEIPIYGQAQDTLDRKRAGIAFAEADLEYVRLSIRAEAIRLYADMRRWQNAYAKRQAIEAAQQQIVKYQNIKHGAGLIDDKEKFEAERAHLTSHQETRLALASLSASQFQLATIVGVTEIPSEWNDLTAVPNFKVDGIGLTPVDVLRSRPDVKRAEATIAQQAAEFELSKSEMYPKFTLTGTLSQLGNVLGNPLPSTTVQLAGVPAISIPLFDWGQRLANAQQENAKFNETIFRYRQNVIEAMNEVNEFLMAHDAAVNNQKSAMQMLDIQEKAAELIALEFEKGTKSGIEKEQAFIAAVEADIAAQTSMAERVTRLASLVKALGISDSILLDFRGETHE